MLLCAWAYGLKSEISLDTGDSASNAVVKRSVVINQRCAECVCLYTMDFASAGKNILLLYVTVCEKVVPRLNKHDDVIKWNFMKIAPPPKWRAGCAPAIGSCRKFIFATGILNSRNCSITDFILFRNDLPANAYCKWYSITKYKVLPQLFHYLFWYVDSRTKTAFCNSLLLLPLVCFRTFML